MVDKLVGEIVRKHSKFEKMMFAGYGKVLSDIFALQLPIHQLFFFTPTFMLLCFLATAFAVSVKSALSYSTTTAVLEKIFQSIKKI